MNRPKVAAYITSYEDKKALDKCISAIIQQTFAVEEIIVIDNSRERVQLEKNLEKITIQHHPENIGISGGLQIGLTWALNQGYDFLWTFDQDSQPDPECLQHLIDGFQMVKNKGVQAGIVAPLSVDCNTQVELHGGFFDRYKFVSAEGIGDLYECDVVITSGSLVSMKAASESEMPEAGLFIDAVDWDYCLKVKEKGYRIFIIKQAIMSHRFSELKLVRVPFLNRKIMINNYHPDRRYYICRNHTYLSVRAANLLDLPMAIGHRVWYYIHSSIKVLVFEKEQKVRKIQMSTVGTIDGLIGRLGKLPIH